jgi:hypothetical protein
MPMKLRQASVITILLITLSSCSLERKMAVNFIKTANEQTILLQFPNQLIKSNLKIDSTAYSKDTDPKDLELIGYNNSLVLKHVNDSIFLDRCKQNMLKELTSYGVNVLEFENYKEISTDSVYLLNLAQIELEEYKDSATIDKFCYGYLRFYDMQLNAINVNSWFELSKLNVSSLEFPVLYSSYYQFDGVEGECKKEFTKRGNEVMYHFEIDDLDAEASYKLASEAGKRYASNFFDYLLNIYVQDNLPAGKTPYFYYHYNREKKVLRKICEDAFIEMDP